MKICSIIFYIKNVSTLRHRSKKFFKIMVSEVPISRKSFLFCCLYTFWNLQLFGYMPYLRAVLYSSRTDLNFKNGQNTCFNISKCTCFLLGFDFSTSSVAAPGGFIFEILNGTTNIGNVIENFTKLLICTIGNEHVKKVFWPLKVANTLVSQTIEVIWCIYTSEIHW